MQTTNALLFYFCSIDPEQMNYCEAKKVCWTPEYVVEHFTSSKDLHISEQCPNPRGAQMGGMHQNQVKRAFINANSRAPPQT